MGTPSQHSCTRSANTKWRKRILSECSVPEGDLCKPKADVIVLIQDSGGISIATVGNIKTVVRRLLTTLGNETQDYNFALAIYASSRDISCFGNAADTISYMDREYQHGQHGTQNLLKRALEKMILKQFSKRRDDRQGNDTVKVSFTLWLCISFLSKQGEKLISIHTRELRVRIQFKGALSRILTDF